MMRILVVDDLADAAVSLATMLRLAGHEAHVALRGDQAVEDAMTFRPHVLLVDIAMPGIGGIEVARRIRASNGLQNTLVIAITGFDGDDIRRRAWAAGIEHYLVKPFDADVLLSLLANHESQVARPSSHH